MLSNSGELSKQIQVRTSCSFSSSSSTGSFYSTFIHGLFFRGCLYSRNCSNLLTGYEDRSALWLPGSICLGPTLLATSTRPKSNQHTLFPFENLPCLALLDVEDPRNRGYKQRWKLQTTALMARRDEMGPLDRSRYINY